MIFKNMDRIVFAGDSVTDAGSVNPVGEGLFDNLGRGICQELAKKYECIYVDFQKMYEEYCKIRHSSYIARDRIHPNQIGATLMAREFLKVCEFDFSK